MSVEFLDLGAAYKELRTEIDKAVSRVMASGWYILGPEVEAFEEEFAAYCEAAHSVGLANGLEALVLALRALEIGPGDEVIVPSNTFIATWLAVSEVGATLVPVEPVSETGNVDPALLEAAVTDRTRAVIAVHLYGQPADLDAIAAVTKPRGIALIEDAAQAHGARYKGRRIGAYGDIVCWSFYPAKNLGAMGDGGAVTTEDAQIADRVRLIGNYGSRKKYLNEVRGMNSRLDPLQAAILRVKLQHLDEWNDRRRAIADRYLDACADIVVTPPAVPEWAEPVWHLFVVRSADRAGLQAHLDAFEIRTQMHYPIAPAQQPAYRQIAHSLAPQPIAERLAAEVLSLPIGPHQSHADTERVINALRRYRPAI